MNYEILYKKMLLIRRFEEGAAKLYKMGEIAGFCHLYIGEEAIVTGIKERLESLDLMITTYRDHGHMLACGMDPKGVMAELTGRIGGFSKGKGGSMHMFSKEKGFMGGHGIVGATSPLGAGMAFAQKYRYLRGQNTHGEKIDTKAISQPITVAFCGDGAMNQGQVYEAFNLASLWKLPVLYVIEDNGYAIGTSKERCCAGLNAGSDLYKRGEPFGIPGIKADGMDIDSVLEAAAWGIDFVRKNCRPAVIQFDTYRFRGHSMSDSTKIYRTKEEEEEVMANRDCLELIKSKIKMKDSEKEAFFQRCEDEIAKVVQEAEDFALSSPEPDSAELYTDICL